MHVLDSVVTQTQILMPIKIEGFFENNLRPILLLISVISLSDFVWTKCLSHPETVWSCSYQLWENFEDSYSEVFWCLCVAAASGNHTTINGNGHTSGHGGPEVCWLPEKIISFVCLLCLLCLSPVQHNPTLHRCLRDYVSFSLWLDTISFMCNRILIMIFMHQDQED